MFDENTIPPLIKSNSKLGENIWHFALPAIKTCPGHSKCADFCYATKRNYKWRTTQERYEANSRMRELPDFIFKVVEQIKQKAKHPIRLVRIHSSGDFDSSGYVWDWIQIVDACPDVEFWAYTRSWDVSRTEDEDMYKALLQLALRPNMSLWWSVDAGMEEPPKDGILRAYAAQSDSDTSEYPIDLVFRVNKKSRKITQSGAIVCPAERQTVKSNRNPNGQKKITCAQCRLCWHTDRLSTLNNRFQSNLPVVQT